MTSGPARQRLPSRASGENTGPLFFPISHFPNSEAPPYIGQGGFANGFMVGVWRCQKMRYFFVERSEKLDPHCWDFGALAKTGRSSSLLALAQSFAGSAGVSLTALLEILLA